MTRTRAIILTASAVATAALALVAWSDTALPRAQVTRVRAPGIARELRILQVSDLHTARFGAGQERVGGLLGEGRFDAAVLTGDLLTFGGGDRTAVRELVTLLRKRTPAVLYVPGNHDDAALAEQLEAWGVTVVTPGRVVRVGDGLARAAVVSADAWGGVTARPSAATPVLVVAMHQPPDEATRARIRALTRGTQVVLAGHTHAGQLRVPFLGAVYAPLRWEADAVRGDSADVWFPETRGTHVTGARTYGSQTVLISPGLGTTVVPLRLFAPSQVEVVRVTP